jgi:hypothetical protein
MAESQDKKPQNPTRGPSWKESYEAVRQPIRDVQAAHDTATDLGPNGIAPVIVDGQIFNVKKDKSGRSMEPVNESSEQPQKP